MQCIEVECNSDAWSHDRCPLHYQQWKRAADYTEGFWQFVKQELNLVEKG